MADNSYYCVILAGGIGSRLWPASRQQRPKQFIDFAGQGQSLLQATYERYARFISTDNILVVSNHQYADIVRRQLPQLDARNLLLEPMRRNTIPSVAWAALEIGHRNPEGCMVVTPADQLIADQRQFEKDILHGLSYAAGHGRLLALGILPTRPETAYGYIQTGDEREENIFGVRSFTEKPEMEFATLFLQNGEFLWNTGLFIWSVQAFLQALDDKANMFSNLLENAESEFLRGVNVSELVERTFPMCPNVSIEQGFLEKADHVDVMLCHFGWADIGTWNALFDSLPKEEGNNAVLGGRTLLYSCSDCLVKSSARKVVVLQGLEDCLVVDEDDVLLVCKKEDQKTVRKLMNDVQLSFGDEFV